jgi:dihydroxycyclohexadiene carboxylate dehydrogenase
VSAQRFAGKSVVITGSAQGIGKEVALRAASEGARLTLADKSPVVEEVAKEIVANGGVAVAVIADLET